MTMTKARPRPAILFLAYLLPYPLVGGGQIKSNQTLRSLASVYDVTLFALIRHERERAQIGHILPFCAGGIRLFPLPRHLWFQLAKGFASLRDGKSFWITRNDAPKLRSAVRDILRDKNFAAIHVDHLAMMQFVPETFPSLPPTVLDQHNVEHQIVRQIATLPYAAPPMRWLARWETKRVREFERESCRRASRILTVTDSDAARLAALDNTVASKIHAVPIGVDTEAFAPADHRPISDSPTIVTLGTLYWLPNVDGLCWFCAEILPRIRATVPNIHFIIVGRRPTCAIRRLGNLPGVTVIADPPDVRPFALRSDVFVVPLRGGSGMRVKILNALAMGLPIVTTRIGAEGIAARDEPEILLAPDNAAGFADAVVRLLTDPALAERLRRNGRRLALERYRIEIVREQLLRFYRQVIPEGQK